ncbi:glucoamylase family protein [Silvibacterium sp.]|uniref:glucoamylase family protein n=1 Tax=Silvibacterium sp. TaxID=1964179 RepID=UPI0039E5AE91
MFQVPAIDQEILDKAGLVPAEMRAHARTVTAQWSVIHRPQSRVTLAPRIQQAEEALNALLAELEDLPSSAAQQGPNPLLEIRENPRLFRAAITEMLSVQKKVPKLPRIVSPLGEEPRVAVIAAAYLEGAKSVWNGSALRIWMDEAQSFDPLELRELWILPTFLKFALLDSILVQADAMLHHPQMPDAGTPQLLTARIKSLRQLGHADWTSLMEPLVAFDAILLKDPAGGYPKMDFDSRENYRKRVAEIAFYSERSESEVAQAAIDFATKAQQQRIEDPRVYLRQAHVGYYLIDRGFPELARHIGYHPNFIDRTRLALRRNPDDFFIIGIEVLTILLMAAIVLPLVPHHSVFGGLTFAFFLLLLPVSQTAIDFINNTVTAIFKATALPKLDFSKGIPVEFTTLVAVPTLLMNEKQVRELVGELEVRFLANQDPNLHFALLTDLPDSVARPRESDRDPLVDLAVRLIDGLNQRYAGSAPKHGSFFLLHRHRIFNARQGVWMGWERKRGKLLDLNKYLKGEFDAFPVKAGDMTVLARTQYIITLDSDTQLPRGTAQSMVGAMAHPLNRAIIDPERRVVTAGYGILQPRVGVSVQSASRSRLAAIYSGQTGFDVYTRAVSDVYQDLYGEGIFTGKGIYEVAALHSVLDRRFPRNSLLSHDLIEGAYARAGLATDIEVIDDYPSHYSAYTRRKHRWVRGDWQIAQWLLSRVPDESGRFVRNPISNISRWKILDNLRRSLVEPLTLILLVAGWLGLPGGPIFWTAVTLGLLFAPTLVQLVFSLGRAMASETPGEVREALLGFYQALVITLLNLVFLPHQTMLSLDAIVRSLVRRFITGQRLLEWETAAEAESNKAKRTPVDRYLAASPVFALALAFILTFFHFKALFVAAPILLLWGLESGITVWLNRAPREEKTPLSMQDEAWMRQHALRIWRFFHEFGGARHNYFIPDNVEEETLFEAARVSPTNFGLLLNARQAAVEMGFLTLPEFCDLSLHSLEAMDRLEKFRGHIYNWYDTHTFKPLTPITVSSVDSGNLVASLYTLRTGAKELLHRPVLEPILFTGLETHWQLLRLQKDLPSELSGRSVPARSASLFDWLQWVAETAKLPALQQLPEYTKPSPDELAWWLRETRARLEAILTLLREYLPWLSCEYASLREVVEQGVKDKNLVPTVENAPEFLDQLEQRLARAWATVNAMEPTDSSSQGILIEKLRSELPAVRQRLTALAEHLLAVSNGALRAAEEMDFAFLADKGRQLLSIGYELATHKLHEATYDMLASEARIATFIAVSRGELPQQGWFKMGRVHTMAYGRAILLSWTGTMFEYLMPALWMRNYPDTLISRSLSAAVYIQREFGRQHGIPWGISESGFGKTDDAGHYHYQAFGIPAISLKYDATAGPVVSPYSTFLAVSVEQQEVIRNLRRMEGMQWVGAYGFYEAADFCESTSKPVVVREWMAHHQGMAMMSLLNLLADNAVQRWFHANPEFQATELLLHEKPIREAGLKAEQKPVRKAKKSAA